MDAKASTGGGAEVRFSVTREGDNDGGNAGGEDRGEGCLVGSRGEGNGGCARERVPCVLRVLFRLY